MKKLQKEEQKVLTVTSRHKISAAHRLYDYDGKCEHLHGHNYQIEVEICSDKTDALGMVIDFSKIKSYLFAELDKLWDHRTLLYEQDPLCKSLQELLQDDSVRAVPFNPTAENMAIYLGSSFFPTKLKAMDNQNKLSINRTTVFETENNSATWHNSHELSSCQ